MVFRSAKAARVLQARRNAKVSIHCAWHLPMFRCQAVPRIHKKLARKKLFNHKKVDRTSWYRKKSKTSQLTHNNYLFTFLDCGCSPVLPLTWCRSPRHQAGKPAAVNWKRRHKVDRLRVRPASSRWKVRCEEGDDDDRSRDRVVRPARDRQLFSLVFY